MASSRVFEKSIEEGHTWLKAICYYSNLDTQDKALIALRTVLHELRDNLTLQNAAKLSTEFPLVIKGIFFEDWTPKRSAIRQKFRKEKENYNFKESIAEKLKKYPSINPEEAITAVFKTVERHIAKEEVEKMRKMLQPEILTYWFEAATYK